jgi:hypothetical protein
MYFVFWLYSRAAKTKNRSNCDHILKLGRYSLGYGMKGCPKFEQGKVPILAFKMADSRYAPWEKLSHLKDNGNKFFYCVYLLSLLMEYLISYFCLSIAFCCSDNLRKCLTNFNSHPPSWENSAYANLCMNTFRDVDGRVNANPTV